jgi:hypothetical protein
MGIIKLTDIEVKLPDWVIWVKWTDSQVFVKGNNINTWCNASIWNVITLIINSANEVIDLECNVHTKKWNKCWNKYTGCDTCIIYPQIKNTTK